MMDDDSIYWVPDSMVLTPEEIEDAKDYVYMLTTYDNPWNPLTNFYEWYQEEIRTGKNTCGHLAKIMQVAEHDSEEDIAIETLRAIKEIVSLDPTNQYTFVREKRTIPFDETSTFYRKKDVLGPIKKDPLS